MFHFKKILVLLVSVLVTVVILFSCRKPVCQTCGNNNANKLPIAIAKPDTTITLPCDSVQLNGSASYDPDGTIVSWSWRKISGPAPFNIVSASTKNTIVRNLVGGFYQFELKVTDNGGLTALDTLDITVNPTSNHPPVANAGPDQTITLPVDSVLLDGSASSDPDNNITLYQWTKITGSTVNIVSPSGIQTKVTGLIPGVYLFQLRVGDAFGLSSTDVIQVTVNDNGTTNYCGSPRPIVNAQMTQIGQLSSTRSYIATVAAGNKIFFAGGSTWPSPSFATTRVDIYDVVTQSWSTAELSKPRWSIATVTAGNKVFFAGGVYFDDGDNAHVDNRIDIYDLATNSWSIDSLSEPRYDAGAATVGNKVFFAGGIKGDDPNNYVSNKVDIYDLSTNTWSHTQLSEPRASFPATTVNNKIYFAGGLSQFETPTNTIDIYDNATNSWSTSSMLEEKYHFAGIAVNNKIYWAGGLYTNQGIIYDGVRSCRLDIRNLTNGQNTFGYLDHQEDFFVDGGQNAVMRDNKIVFFTGSRWLTDPIPDTRFDIYDINSGSFSVGLLPFGIEGASIISVNNTIYVAGGFVNGSQWTNQVWKLEF